MQHYGGLKERKKYNPYQQKWHAYCQENNINPVRPIITNVLDFLSNLYDQVIYMTNFFFTEVKRCAIITYKHGVYELPQEMSNN